MQGSGWGWLGYSPELKRLVITTTANQDPLSTQVNVCACSERICCSSVQATSQMPTAGVYSQDLEATVTPACYQLNDTSFPVS